MVEVSCYRVTCIRNKVIYYYVNAFNKKEAEGSNVRNMVEWLLTSEGQKAMSNAGYVPVKATK